MFGRLTEYLARCTDIRWRQRTNHSSADRNLRRLLAWNSTSRVIRQRNSICHDIRRVSRGRDRRRASSIDFCGITIPVFLRHKSDRQTTRRVASRRLHKARSYYVTRGFIYIYIYVRDKRVKHWNSVLSMPRKQPHLIQYMFHFR